MKNRILVICDNPKKEMQDYLCYKLSPLTERNLLSYRVNTLEIETINSIYTFISPRIENIVGFRFYEIIDQCTRKWDVAFKEYLDIELNRMSYETKNDKCFEYSSNQFKYELDKLKLVLIHELKLNKILKFINKFIGGKK